MNRALRQSLWRRSLSDRPRPVSIIRSKPRSEVGTPPPIAVVTAEQHPSPVRIRAGVAAGAGPNSRARSQPVAVEALQLALEAAEDRLVDRRAGRGGDRVHDREIAQDAGRPQPQPVLSVNRHRSAVCRRRRSSARAAPCRRSGRAAAASGGRRAGIFGGTTRSSSASTAAGVLPGARPSVRDPEDVGVDRDRRPRRRPRAGRRRPSSGRRRAAPPAPRGSRGTCPPCRSTRIWPERRHVAGLGAVEPDLPDVPGDSPPRRAPASLPAWGRPGTGWRWRG